jgi:DNA-binding response OmpR family regulator
MILGNFVIDADARSAKLDGVDIPLTKKEFDILFRLLSYPEKPSPEVSFWMPFGA